MQARYHRIGQNPAGHQPERDSYLPPFRPSGTCHPEARSDGGSAVVFVNAAGRKPTPDRSPFCNASRPPTIPHPPRPSARPARCHPERSEGSAVAFADAAWLNGPRTLNTLSSLASMSSVTRCHSERSPGCPATGSPRPTSALRLQPRFRPIKWLGQMLHPSATPSLAQIGSCPGRDTQLRKSGARSRGNVQSLSCCNYFASQKEIHVD